MAANMLKHAAFRAPPVFHNHYTDTLHHNPLQPLTQLVHTKHIILKRSDMLLYHISLDFFFLHSLYPIQPNQMMTVRQQIPVRLDKYTPHLLLAQRDLISPWADNTDLL